MENIIDEEIIIDYLKKIVVLLKMSIGLASYEIIESKLFIVS
jgi:hypothetical protein